MNRTPARLPGLAAAIVIGTLVLAGCGENTDAGHGSTSDHNASTSTSTGAEAAFNDTDTTFAAGMVPHHQSAIEMAQLAEGRAADPRVLDLADRIEAAQGPEIETLTGWLEQWGAGDGHDMDDGMGHGASGMMSEEDMQALRNATGAAFDRLFLEQMIVHHTGAVEMAETELEDGRSTDALALAETIRDSQSAEIAEMERLLAELGG